MDEIKRFYAPTILVHGTNSRGCVYDGTLVYHGAIAIPEFVVIDVKS